MSKELEQKQFEELAKLIYGGRALGKSSAEIAKILQFASYRKQEWISVDERLPTKEDANEYGDVLAITYKNRRVQSWNWELVKKNSSMFTHWMPLPEAPKMKGGAE